MISSARGTFQAARTCPLMLKWMYQTALTLTQSFALRLRSIVLNNPENIVLRTAWFIIVATEDDFVCRTLALFRMA